MHGQLFADLCSLRHGQCTGTYVDDESDHTGSHFLGFVLTADAEVAIGPQVFHMAQESMEKMEKRSSRYHLLVYTTS
jgi:hypothetical protein